MPKLPTRYHLFIDESGDFREGAERSESDGRDFPSQIVGVVAPAGHFTHQVAESLLSRAYEAAGRTLGKTIHGAELKKGVAFDSTLETLANALGRDPQLRPVRIVNRERLSFGGRIPTYTNMLAELVVQIFEELSKRHEGPVQLDVTYAIWMVDEVQVRESEYRKRLEERLAQTMAQRGRAGRSKDWLLGKTNAESARTVRTLQVCDLLSNGSHDDYCKVGKGARAALEAAFGAFDLGWSVRAMTGRVEDLIEGGALGLALVELAPTLSDPEVGADERRAPTERLGAIVNALAGMDESSREAQLGVLTTWLSQLIDFRGALRRGLEVTDWAIATLLPALRETTQDDDEPSLDVLAFQLHRLALTGANHLGALLRARAACAAIDALIPSIQGRWEHAALLIDALTHQAVHETDALDYAQSMKRMTAVAGYYRELSEMFALALPDYFSEEMRSEGRGKALGTLLQAEAYAGMRDAALIESARAHSDEAMKEFANRGDIARQEQYRALIETVGSAWPAARAWLGKSLDMSDAEPDHEALAAHIAAMEGFGQGFALLHWSRLAAFAARKGDGAERDAMLEAAGKYKLLAAPWVVGEVMEYPAHGIRRYLAVALAAAGQDKVALSVLGHLRKLDASPKEHIVFALTAAAAQTEVAALLWPSDEKAARRLIEGKGNVVGARKLVHLLRQNVTKELPALQDALHRWHLVLAEPNPSPKRLVDAARLIPD